MVVMNKLEKMTIELTQACPNECLFCSSYSSVEKVEHLELKKIKEIFIINTESRKPFRFQMIF